MIRQLVDFLTWTIIAGFVVFLVFRLALAVEAGRLP